MPIVFINSIGRNTKQVKMFHDQDADEYLCKLYKRKTYIKGSLTRSETEADALDTAEFMLRDDYEPGAEYAQPTK